MNLKYTSVTSFETKKANNSEIRACLTTKYNEFCQTLFPPQGYDSDLMENYYCYFLNLVINQNTVGKATGNTYQHHPLPSLFEYRQDIFFSKR